MSLTAIVNQSPQINVNLSPNPAKDIVTVMINDKKLTIKALSLHNIYGETILEEKYNEKRNRLSLRLPQELISGIYFVKVLVNGKWITKKLVVK